jgi:hypothetical protein
MKRFVIALLLIVVMGWLYADMAVFDPIGTERTEMPQGTGRGAESRQDVGVPSMQRQTGVTTPIDFNSTPSGEYGNTIVEYHRYETPYPTVKYGNDEEKPEGKKWLEILYFLGGLFVIYFMNKVLKLPITQTQRDLIGGLFPYPKLRPFIYLVINTIADVENDKTIPFRGGADKKAEVVKRLETSIDAGTRNVIEKSGLKIPAIVETVFQGVFNGAVNAGINKLMGK